MRKKRQRVLVVSLFAIIAGVHLAVWIAGRDIAPPDTRDLVLERMDLAPEQNAYTFFASATNSLYWPTNSTPVTGYLDGAPCDEDVIQDVVAQNTAMLDLVGKGVECRSYQSPEVTGFDFLMPCLSPWRNMGRVMAIKARQERLAGRHPEATQTCIRLIRFGNMIQKDAGCLIEYLVGCGVLDLGLTQARDLACDKNTSEAELIELAKALTSVGSLDRGLIRSFKVEYRISSGALDMVESSRNGRANELSALVGEKIGALFRRRRMPGYVFQPNKTRLEFANLFRKMILMAPRPYADMDRSGLGEDQDMHESVVKLLLRPNMVGRVLFRVLVPAIGNTLERKCRGECTVVATRLMAACNAYRKKEGRLPDTLQLLVPTYLPAVPLDPFDGKPFRYSAAAGIIYSVGCDGKDSGGSSKNPEGKTTCHPAHQRWQAEDVVFEL